jgi:hypothetical protein
MGAEMALQLASESLGEREERDFQRRLENPPSPATERRLLLTAKRFHTVCVSFANPSAVVGFAEPYYVERAGSAPPAVFTICG